MDTPCINYKGTIKNTGYGIWRKNGVSIYAHRLVYELLVGKIPQGYTIDHLCRNKACVNPQHLEAVTQRVNVMRSDAPTSINAQKTHCSNGHEFTIENTYRRKDGRRICKACEKTYHRQYYLKTR